MPIESRFSVAVPQCSIQSWIFNLNERSQSLSNRKAWIDASNPSRYLTYASAHNLAKRLAVGLHQHGINRGNRVLVFAGNSVTFPALVLGIWMSGAVFTGANPGYTASELAYQLEDSGAMIMIATESSWDAALQAAELAGLEKGRVFQLDGWVPGIDEKKELHESERVQHWGNLLGSEEEAAAFMWEEPRNPHEMTCTLNYSSGTTGLPKGVELTHHNHVANGAGIAHLSHLHPSHAERTARAAALCFIPMYHAFSQGYFLSVYPRQQIPVYVMPQFDLSAMLRHIEEFSITNLFVVPPILAALAKHPLARRVDLGSLEMVGSGAAALPKATQDSVNEVLPRNKNFPPGKDGLLREGFGMTELTCTGLGWDPTRPAQSGIGELLPDCKAKIISIENGEEVDEPGVPGELLISGPNVMKGYWQNPAATLATIAHDESNERWLRTGDMAYFDSSSPGAIFHIVDRKKELIKVSGFQVSPTELENLLLSHPDVLDAATVGVVVDGGEMPRAYVVPRQGAQCSAGDVQRWVEGRAVRYKRLKGGVVFVDAIPKNASGKVLRKVLRDRAKREVEEGVRARL